MAFTMSLGLLVRRLSDGGSYMMGKFALPLVFQGVLGARKINCGGVCHLFGD